MKIKMIASSMNAANCYMVYDENDLIIVDPGANARGINDTIKKEGRKLSAILLTHGHYDHMGAAQELKEMTGSKIYAYEGEEEVLMDPRLNLSSYMGGSIKIQADVLFPEGEMEAFNNIKVIHTPGHTKGSVCFLFEDFLITGDTLFNYSIGRTDLPTGNVEDMIGSLKKLSQLSDDLDIYPGHEGKSNLGLEKRNNPYLQQING